MGSRRCGFIDRVGQGRDVGNGLGDGKSLSGGAGKVASRPVVLPGIMSWGTAKVGDCIAHNSASWSHDHGANTVESDEGGEKREGVSCGSWRDNASRASDIVIQALDFAQADVKSSGCSL